MTALLLVGHGSRDPAGVAGFTELVTRVAARAAPVAVAGGFIELSAPPLRDAVAELAARGERDAAAVPVVLSAAGHAKGDIPAALAREAQRSGLRFAYGRPLGPHPHLLALAEARIGEVLGDAERPAATVVLVGRGSTDPDANAEHAKLARLLWEGRGFAGVEPAFISLAEPGVAAALHRGAQLGAQLLTVVPYFLFNGVLPARVTKEARSWAGSHPALDVRYAGVLGVAERLVDLVLERYAEACHGDIRMNCDTCRYRVALPGHAHQVGAPARPHDHPHDPVGTG